MSGESAVGTILALLTALALCASASAGLAQQNAASQPMPYLNAQAAPPAAATPSAPAAPQAVAPAAAQPAPATATAVPAASAPEAGGDNAKSLKSTVPVPRDLSPWSMFLSADVIVKAVMIGLAFASLVTWTIFIAKIIELSVARGKLRRSLKTTGESRSLADAQFALGSKTGVLSAFLAAAMREARAPNPCRMCVRFSPAALQAARHKLCPTASPAGPRPRPYRTPHRTDLERSARAVWPLGAWPRRAPS